MKHDILALTISLVMLTGCATPFAEFYVDRTGGVDIKTMPDRYVLTTEEPKLYQGKTPTEDKLKMMEDNYEMIGYASFNGANFDSREALQHAKRVHAAIVLVYSQYTNTRSSSIPLTLPDTKSSTTSLSGTMYGPAGITAYTGTTSSTTYGTQTIYVPEHVDRYDFLATFWAKGTRPCLGVVTQDLPHDERQRLGTNKGVEVIAVIKGSPAFHADILRRDVITRIGELDVYDGDSFSKAVDHYAGEKTHVRLLRQTETKVVPVTLNKL